MPVVCSTLILPRGSGDGVVEAKFGSGPTAPEPIPAPTRAVLEGQENEQTL